MAKKENLKSASGKGSKVDTGIIRLVARMMEEEDLVELLYEQADIKIQLKKKGCYSSTPMSAPQTQSSAMVQAAAPIAPVQTAAQAAEERNAAKENNPALYILKSPMVGTFYRAASPDSPPFVNVGDMVEPGKTLCIIEAMKIMNEIKCEVAGKVKEITAENAQTVEFNQHMIVIEKS